MPRITVGTRRSALAKTQTLQIIKALSLIHSDLEVSVKEVVTKGDRIQDKALSEVGGKGLFVSEIEELLLNGEIDFAVHSMKDVPAELADGLTIGAIPKREDARDMLISEHGYTLDSLPQGARIGTSSLRRSAQLLSIRSDVLIEPLRGNIDTRLQKLAGLDGIILAAAGLIRMGWWQQTHVLTGEREYPGTALQVSDFLPAVGQGALALECRQDDPTVSGYLETLHDSLTAACVKAEREFLAAVGGSCQVPVGAYAQISQGRLGDSQVLHIVGFIGSPDGKISIRKELSGDINDSLGAKLGRELLESGGAEILSALASSGPKGWK